MRNIRYFLFLILLSFSIIINAKAYDFYIPIGTDEVYEVNGVLYAQGAQNVGIQYGYGHRGDIGCKAAGNGECSEDHPAIDYDVPSGTNAIAATSGKVVQIYNGCRENVHSGCNGDAGNVVTIDIGNGYYMMYLHLLPDGIMVKPGDTVNPGQLIAKTGSTGAGMQEHLDFRIQKNCYYSGCGSKSVNPADLGFDMAKVYDISQAGVDAVRFIEETPQSIVLSNGSLAGVACSSFMLSFSHVAGTRPGYSPATGEVGLYSNQNAVRYRVSPGAECPGGDYAFLCLDIGVRGVESKDGSVEYSASPIDLNTDFGKAIYALYKQYHCSSGDDRCVLEFQTAARILEFMSSDYAAIKRTDKTRDYSDETPYKGDYGSIGTLGPSGAALAQSAWASKDSVGDSSGVLGVTLTPLGVNDYSANSFTTRANVVVQNYTASKDKVSGISYSVDGGGLAWSEISRQETGGNLVITGELSGSVNSGDCSAIQVKVTLNYTSNNDASNVMLVSGPNIYQDGLVFKSGGSSGGGNANTIYNYASINPGNAACNPDTNGGNGGPACKTEFSFACGSDGQSVSLIEGSNGGETDWEGCIIGHTDARGNSYDILSTEDRVVEEELIGTEGFNETGLSTDDILGFLAQPGSVESRTIKSAHYCTLSCKEDYYFVLPGAKHNIKQGTYFEFNVGGNSGHNVAGVGAERSCVSSGINYGGYDEIVLNLRKQQLDYLNMYNYYKTIYNLMRTEEQKDNYLKGYSEVSPVINGVYTKHDGNGNLSESYRDEYISGEPSGKYFYSPDPKKDANGVPIEEWIYYNAWSGNTSGPFDREPVIKPGSTLAIPYYQFEEGDLPGELHLKVPEEPGEIPIDDISLSYEEALKKLGLKPNVDKFEYYDDIYGDYVYQKKMEIGQNEDAPEIKTIYWKEWHSLDSQADGLCSNSSWFGCSQHAEQEYYWDGVTNADGSRSGHEWTRFSHYHYAYYTVEHREVSIRHLSDTSRDGRLAKYEEMLINLMNTYTTALEKYNALTKQIKAQADAMQQCTNYLETVNDNYDFNPQIVFSYDQDSYMDMMAPNILVPEDGQINPPSKSLYYCKNDTNAAGVFSCGGVSAEDNVKFAVYQPLQDSGDGVDPVPPVPDKVEYNDVARVGSKITYGMQYFKSGTKFYTEPPDGIVYTSSGFNRTILGGDGYVYPVKISTSPGTHNYSLIFSNIGQYFELGALGRLMGGGVGKLGVYSGAMFDSEVCTYEICRIDDPNCYGGTSNENPPCNPNTDPNCPPNPNDPSKPGCNQDTSCNPNCNYDPDCSNPVDDNSKDCINIIDSDKCNKGSVSNLSPYKAKECINALINKNCCYQKDYGRYSAEYIKNINGITISEIPDYLAKCAGHCTSFNIENYTGTIATSNYSDLVDIDNEGELQMTVRHVSLNNLFPNGSRGVNWESIDGNASKVNNVVNTIQQKGESVYAESPEYSISLSPACSAEIREYNKSHENSYDKGYYYYSMIVDENVGKPGSNVYSSEFVEFLRSSGCDFTFKNEPDAIN